MRKPMWNSKNEKGQATIIAAVVICLLTIGFMAFAIDVGYMFREKRMAQAAADAAAVAAAEEVTYDGTGTIGTDAQDAANAAATLNGFNTSAATHPATVTLSTSNSGNYSNAGSATVPATWVEAQVSQPISTFFLPAVISGKTTLNVSATAYAAGQQTSGTCVCLESQSGADLTMSNAAKITGSSCGVTVDSSSNTAISIVGGAEVCTESISAVASDWDTSGNIYNGGTICGTTTVVQGLSTRCSPTMPSAPAVQSCGSDPLNNYSQAGSTYTVGPNSGNGTTYTVGGVSAICYTSLTLGANTDTVTLNPGIYVINGGWLTFDSGKNNKSNLGGNGVFFYLENNAGFVVQNGANTNLVAGGNTENGGGTAPSTGTYNGILLYQAASDTQEVSIQGGSTIFMSGALYAPGAELYLVNGTGTTITGDVVANTLTMAGAGTLAVNPSVNLGTANLSVAKLTQ